MGQLTRWTRTLPLLLALAALLAQRDALADEVEPARAARAARRFVERQDARDAQRKSGSSAERHRTLGPPQPVRGVDGITLAYLHSIRGGGFVLTSSDTRIAPVIGYSASGTISLTDSPGNVALHLLLADQGWHHDALRRAARGKSGDSPPDEWKRSERAAVALGDCSNYLGNPDLRRWGPLLPERIDLQHQGTRDDQSLNRYFPLFDPHNSEYPNARWPAGCVMTATAQVLMFWRYPDSLSLEGSPSEIALPPHFRPPEGYNTAESGAPTLGQVQSRLSPIQYGSDYNATESESALALAIALKLNAVSSSDESGPYTGAFGTRIADFLREDCGYGSAVCDGAVVGTNVWPRVVETVIDDIRHGRPVIIGIRESYSLVRWAPRRHELVVDGYDEAEEMFHLDFGWDDTEVDVWYRMPNACPFGYDYDFNVVTHVNHSIQPRAAWTQFGADEANSSYAPFPAPTSSSVKERWRSRQPSSQPFDTFVVGRGGRVYATENDPQVNGGPTRNIWVFDREGVLVTVAAVPSGSGRITSPVTDAAGNVYVGAANGNIYKLNYTTNQVSQFWREPNGRSLADIPLVITDTGYILATTDDSGAPPAPAQKVYRVSPDGASSQPWTAPSGSTMYFRPAVDETRGYVFVTSKNSSNQSGTLTLIRLSSMTQIHAVTPWTNLTLASHYALAPVVDQVRQQVSVGCRGTLYGYTVSGTERLTPLWTYPTSLGRPQGPAVNLGTGRLYTTYYDEVAGVPVRRIVGLDPNPATGGCQVGPTFTLTLSDLDRVSDIRAAENGVIVFSVWSNSGSASAETLYALRDNGSTFTQLWTRSVGSRGSGSVGRQVVIGPDRTVYALGDGTGRQAIIGIGEPSWLGKGYVDNQRPGAATSGSSSQYALSASAAQARAVWTVERLPRSAAIGATAEEIPVARLSWEAVDPDGQDVDSVVELRAETDEVGTSIGIAPGQTSLEVAGLKPGTTYYWSVTTSDGQATQTGSTWQFTTDPAPATIDGDPTEPPPVVGSGGATFSETRVRQWMVAAVLSARYMDAGELGLGITEDEVAEGMRRFDAGVRPLNSYHFELTQYEFDGRSYSSLSRRGFPSDPVPATGMWLSSDISTIGDLRDLLGAELDFRALVGFEPGSKKSDAVDVRTLRKAVERLNRYVAGMTQTSDDPCRPAAVAQLRSALAGLEAIRLTTPSTRFGVTTIDRVLREIALIVDEGMAERAAAVWAVNVNVATKLVRGRERVQSLLDRSLKASWDGKVLRAAQLAGRAVATARANESRASRIAVEFAYPTIDWHSVTPASVPVPVSQPDFSGVEIDDESGSAHDARLRGAALLEQESASGRSYIQFDGGSWVEVEDASDLHLTGDWTLLYWMRLDAEAATGEQVVLSTGGAVGSPLGGVRVWYAGEGTLNVTMDAAAGAGQVLQVPVPDTLGWHHFAVRREGSGASAGRITLYIDGEEAGSGTRSTPVDSGRRLLVGADYDDADTVHPRSTAALADVRLYSTALTGDSVRLAEAAFGGEVPFAAGETLQALPQSALRVGFAGRVVDPGGHPGRVSGQVRLLTDAASGRRYASFRADWKVLTPDAPELDLTSDWAISFMARAVPAVAGVPVQVLAKGLASVSGGGGYSVWFAGSTLKLQSFSAVGQGSAPLLIAGVGDTGSWRHYTLVQRVDDGVTRVYVDGTPVAQSGVMGALLPSTQPLVLGGAMLSDGTYELSNGLDVADLRIFNVSLTDLQIGGLSAIAHGDWDGHDEPVLLTGGGWSVAADPFQRSVASVSSAGDGSCQLSVAGPRDSIVVTQPLAAAVHTGDRIVVRLAHDFLRYTTGDVRIWVGGPAPGDGVTIYHANSDNPVRQSSETLTAYEWVADRDLDAGAHAYLRLATGYDVVQCRLFDVSVLRAEPAKR